MSAKVFVDTNILVYARDSSENEKQITANQWMAYLCKTGLGRLSYQSCNEYYVVTTQRIKPGLSKKKLAMISMHLKHGIHFLLTEQPSKMPGGFRINTNSHGGIL